MQKIQEIIKNSMQKHKYNNNITKALNQIEMCHTKQLGYLMIKCQNCEHQELITKSCRNRNCPLCQKSSQEKWINKWLKAMLDCKYYHIVATIPDELYQITYENQKIMYKIIQKASAQAIIKICKDEKYIGGKPGILQILHTWTQKMLYHPHCHMLVTSGGIKDDEWVDAKNEKYLFPVKVYSLVYRGMYIQELQKVRKKLKFSKKTKEYKNDANWEKLIKELYKKEFVTYIKEPYEEPKTVMDYFGRYAYRVAITESRIISYENGIVKFKYHDRKDGNKEKIEEISDEKFVERFVMHILPKGFRKIKAYGIFANAYREERIEKIKKVISKIRNRIIEFVRKEVFKKCCSKCGSEDIEIILIAHRYEVPT